MILAVNTSTPQFSLALIQQDRNLLAEYTGAGAKGRFGALMPALQFVLSANRVLLQDIAGIAVSVGPGSFTGLRVGISLAKGLSHSLNIPLVGVSSLEALAEQLSHVELPVAAILDSRRGEFFTARFSCRDGGPPERISEDLCVRAEQIPEHFPKPCLFIGNDFGGQVPVLRDALGPSVALAPWTHWHLRASSVGSLGINRLKRADYDDPEQINPVYLRPPHIRANPSLLRHPLSRP